MTTLIAVLLISISALLLLLNSMRNEDDGDELLMFVVIAILLIALYVSLQGLNRRTTTTTSFSANIADEVRQNLSAALQELPMGYITEGELTINLPSIPSEIVEDNVIYSVDVEKYIDELIMTHGLQGENAEHVSKTVRFLFQNKWLQVNRKRFVASVEDGVFRLAVPLSEISPNVTGHSFSVTYRQ